MKILHVVGARPNFMKVGPVMKAMKGRFDQTLVHTGQHYDANLSEIFFRQLGLPEPDVNLEVGSASHAVQTAQIMMRFDEVVAEQKPDWVMVYGDVNSTLAAALVCAKLYIPVAHVEAGLRSHDRRMPEELNRILTDQISSLLFTPSPEAREHLLGEGIPEERIRFVGNVMIDTLIDNLPKAKMPEIKGLREQFALVTLHRHSNVNQSDMLAGILKTLKEISRDIQLVFPVHPKTRSRFSQFGLDTDNNSDLLLIEPQGYHQFIALQQRAKLVITDSGGIQEETTYLGTPCLTVRENTERPVTITEGSNTLVGLDMNRLKREVWRVLSGDVKSGGQPELWDGRAGERIAEVIAGSTQMDFQFGVPSRAE